MGKAILPILLGALALPILSAADISVPLVSIAASSSLPDSESGSAAPRRIRYSGDKAFDGRPDTAWVEGVPGPGIGQGIAIKTESSIAFDSVEILPGYFDERYFAANNRIKAFSLEAVEEKGLWKESFSCADGMKSQVVKLSRTVTAREIRLTILEVYEGSRWDDTCLSEFRFRLGNARYALSFSRIEYDRGSYKPSFNGPPITLYPEGYSMLLELREGGKLTGDLDYGNQVGMPISEGTWRFRPDGAVELSYTHYDGYKRMDPETDPPAEYVSGSMRLMVLGLNDSAEFMFSEGTGLSCRILERK